MRNVWIVSFVIKATLFITNQMYKINTHNISNHLHLTVISIILVVSQPPVPGRCWYWYGRWELLCSCAVHNVIPTRSTTVFTVHICTNALIHCEDWSPRHMSLLIVMINGECVESSPGEQLVQSTVPALAVEERKRTHVLSENWRDVRAKLFESWQMIVVVDKEKW